MQKIEICLSDKKIENTKNGITKTEITKIYITKGKNLTIKSAIEKIVNTKVVKFRLKINNHISITMIDIAYISITKIWIIKV